MAMCQTPAQASIAMNLLKIKQNRILNRERWWVSFDSGFSGDPSFQKDA